MIIFYNEDGQFTAMQFYLALGTVSSLEAKGRCCCGHVRIWGM